MTARDVNINSYRESGRPAQLSLPLDVHPDPVLLVKNALAEAAKLSKYSREQLCDRVNHIVTRLGLDLTPLTPATLDKFCAASSRAHVPSLKLLPLLCAALESNLPLIAYAQAFAGVRVIDEDDAHVLAWARAEIELKRARARARRLGEEVMR